MRGILSFGVTATIVFLSGFVWEWWEKRRRS